MMPLILAVNAGSSSLKISLYERAAENPEEPRLLLTSTIAFISAPPAKVTFQHISTDQPARRIDTSEPSIRDHESAFIHFLGRLEKDASVDRQQVRRICHRVVHGGDYTQPTIISKASYDHIKMLSDLAPLHNAAALSVMNACLEALPHALSIAFFDTAFHKDMPRHVSTYAIDQDVARERGLRKYGFHGLSYAFIRRAVAQHLHKREDELNMIAMHLGSGASVCAIRGGKSIDTSMGLTPLSGLPGATRAGDVDPSLVFHYGGEPISRLSYDSVTTQEIHVTKAENLLNRQAGWKALTGTTDFGEITRRADVSVPPAAATDPCTLAFHVVRDRVLHYVGAYHLALGGDVDALVFAGGIGERSQALRRAVGAAVERLGYPAIEGRANEEEVDRHPDAVVVDIGKKKEEGEEGGSGGKRVLVCRTDEQLEMARQCSLEAAFWGSS